MTLPTFDTPRLCLRPFTLADADAVTAAAGVREVAATTLYVPHPYPPGAAAEWIATHADAFAQRSELTLAVVDRASGALRGAINLVLTPMFDRGEIGYWMAREGWGQGFATEAATAIVGFGFTALGLVRIVGHCMAHNPGSARVLEKVGMQREGLLRQHVKRDGRHIDVLAYGLLRAEWRGPAPTVRA
ncbi:MAG: GNAT family N-acetyltransferase [Deltaproteobacteria bacterium]|nr:GNAT family N-acetyltransferase [Deltaproteobacteria bacterium]